MQQFQATIKSISGPHKQLQDNITPILRTHHVKITILINALGYSSASNCTLSGVASDNDINSTGTVLLVSLKEGQTQEIDTLAYQKVFLLISSIWLLILKLFEV